MYDLALIAPRKDHELRALAFVQEHLMQDEGNIHGSGGLRFAESYDAWLEKLRNDLDPDKLTEGRVVGTTYFAVRERDGEIVGTLNLRHELNAKLLEIGGHIGYGVRPSERGKGYATQMLKLALLICRDLGIERVLVTCDQGNDASRRVIVKNGGAHENDAVEESGTVVERYWIELRQ